MVEFIVKGLSGAKGLKVTADVFAGRVTMLKVQDVKSSKYLARYEHHEWLFNKLPLHHINEIIDHVIDGMF